ncbi:MAG TPA: MFS transporter [Candidatus Paceibacterota bacterium]
MRKVFSQSMILALFVAFLYESESALLSYINSTFLTENFNLSADQVGLLFSAGSIISLILLFIAPKYIYKFGKQKILVTFSLITALCVFLVSSIPFPLAAFMFILFLAGNQIIWYLIDLEVEDETPVKDTGRMRGVLFTLLNFSWLIFPALAARLIGHGISLSAFYTWTAVALVTIAITTLLQPDSRMTPKISPSQVSYAHILEFFKSTERNILFGVHLILKIFYAVMIIYTPLYLREVQNIPWSQIDGIFFVMLLPFVLLEFPIGYLEDKKFKEHFFLRIGFVVMFISLIVFVLTTSPKWIIWALILFSTRIGAALIEVSAESAFFKKIKRSEIEFISVFRSATPIAFIVTPIFASVLISSSSQILAAFTIPIVLSGLGFYKSWQLSRLK